ncbi:unnamed protein product [Brachionus calyciflorus]|uniref:Uncharacterized protein n=1 Tax=Brachionus calyciflorus TaxID=104777 RepID=A0A813P375_9BILA|nr:unnamed protein product [Brachionus calyciflorus]
MVQETTNNDFAGNLTEILKIINNQLALLRTNLAAFRTDVTGLRTDMNFYFDFSEHKALTRMSNASCVRNNSRINWIRIPNRNLPQHRIYT